MVEVPLVDVLCMLASDIWLSSHAYHVILVMAFESIYKHSLFYFFIEWRKTGKELPHVGMVLTGRGWRLITLYVWWMLYLLFFYELSILNAVKDSMAYCLDAKIIVVICWLNKTNAIWWKGTSYTVYAGLFQAWMFFGCRFRPTTIYDEIGVASRNVHCYTVIGCW